jgi:tetratricopeptide (TPR) repeat protein
MDNFDHGGGFQNPPLILCMAYKTNKVDFGSRNWFRRGKEREMLKRNIRPCILILALSVFLTGFTPVALKKDFVSFDQAFIPPLALTRAEKVKPSKKAMKILKENWGTFKAKYYDANSTDPKWKEDFNKVDQKIMEAAKTIKNGKNLIDAHESLEEIRYIFLELRKRNGINYYIDPLSEFHVFMEVILHTADENDPDTLNDSDKETIREQYDQASRIWNRIKKLEFDRDFYGFNDEKMAKMNKYLKMESEALNKLEKALDDNNNALIIETAKAIKPNYAKLYKLFGDFERVKGQKS